MIEGDKLLLRSNVCMDCTAELLSVTVWDAVDDVSVFLLFKDIPYTLFIGLNASPYIWKSHDTMSGYFRDEISFTCNELMNSMDWVSPHVEYSLRVWDSVQTLLTFA